MNPTQMHPVGAGVVESGINTFLRALFTARPHYLHYGSVPFVSASSVSATNVPAVPFPGLPGGLPYAVSFSTPLVELSQTEPDSSTPVPSALYRLGLKTRARITVGCFSWAGGHAEEQTEQTGRVIPVSFELEVWAAGALVAQSDGPGTGCASLRVLSVRLPEVRPEGFEEVIECAVRMLLQAALSHVQLPLHVLGTGSLQLMLESGPAIDSQAAAR